MPWYEKTEHRIAWEVSTYFQLSGTRTHEFFCGLEGSKNQTQVSSWLKWIPVKSIVRRSEVPACQRVCTGRTDGGQELPGHNKSAREGISCIRWYERDLLDAVHLQESMKALHRRKSQNSDNITGVIQIPDEKDQLSHIRLHSCSLILLPNTAYLSLMLLRKLDLGGAKKIGQLEEGEIEWGKDWELTPSPFSLSFASHNLG